MLFPRGFFAKIPAIKDWFDRDVGTGRTIMNETYFKGHEETVELEVTETTSDSMSTLAFSRLSLPLSSFIRVLNMPPPDIGKKTDVIPSLYLAQTTPLAFLEPALPTPRVVKVAGKGDIYGHSLWLGTTPTTTPLHRDPNPNLLVQLSGKKVVRLVSPQIGKGLVEIAGGPGGNLSGEEMMQGKKRQLLELLVWGNPFGSEGKATTSEDQQEYERWEALREGMFEVTLESGDGIFIPTGWYHAVRGVGQHERDRVITASVNWWFR